MGVESALLALGVGAKTAATIGTIGSVVGTGLSLASAASSIFGGMQSQAEAERQSQLAIAQAEMQGRESARQSVREAGFAKQDADATMRRQKLAYLASGVTLEGSPLLMMEETRMRGADNVNEILTSGAYAKTAARAEGRITAAQLKSSGRESFVSGLTSAGSTLGRLF